MEREKAQSGHATEGQAAGQEASLGHRAGKPGLILYLDTSAIVKKYVAEPGSVEIRRAVAAAQSVGTALITRVEVAAAFAKAVRTAVLTAPEGEGCLQSFRKDWANYYVAEVSSAVVSRAETYAWMHQLRGYDAVHLAAASVWQDDLGHRVTLATFDLNLWRVAETVGLAAFPEDLPDLIEARRQGTK